MPVICKNEQMSIKLSIIIPIFNVEPFLAECIESLLKTDRIFETEILLVDDGSTDGSGAVADSFAMKYDNIKCYHKKNGGLSETRNYGIKHAQGEFIVFIDSDDCVNSDLFAHVIRKLSDFDGDILLWDADIIDEKGCLLDNGRRKYVTHKGVAPYPARLNGINVLEQQLSDHPWYTVSACLGAYRRVMLVSNKLWFKEGILHEDEVWTPAILLHASSIYYLPEKIYLYRTRNGSIMHNTGNDTHIDSLIYCFSFLFDFYSKTIENKHLLEKLDASIARRYLHAITEFDFYRSRKSKDVNKWLLLEKSKGMKDKCRALLLLVNGKLYCAVTRALNSGE